MTSLVTLHSPSAILGGKNFPLIYCFSFLMKEYNFFTHSRQEIALDEQCSNTSCMTYFLDIFLVKCQY